MFDPSAMPRPAMSAERFAALGENRVAYIKAIRSEEVAFLCAEAPLLPPGHCVFVLHAADGTPIMLTDSREAAIANAGARSSRPSACTEVSSGPNTILGPVCDLGHTGNRCGDASTLPGVRLGPTV